MVLQNSIHLRILCHYWMITLLCSLENVQFGRRLGIVSTHQEAHARDTSVYLHTHIEVSLPEKCNVHLAPLN